VRAEEDFGATREEGEDVAVGDENGGNAGSGEGLGGSATGEAAWKGLVWMRGEGRKGNVRRSGFGNNDGKLALASSVLEESFNRFRVTDSENELAANQGRVRKE
jgi:hypothetical protein